MKIILYLSGEHPHLPRREVEAVLEGEGRGYEVALEDEAGRILVLNTRGDDYGFVKRLALSRKAGEVLCISSDLGEIAERVYGRIKDARAFAVRCSSRRLEVELGGLLAAKGLRVDLSNPDVEVLCSSLKEKIVASLNIPLERDFNNRLPQKRPFFHPTSMHPKIARLLVNLSRVKAGDTLLDPFCGTGGILLEAGLLGIGVMGFDVDARMVEGCRRNLGFYGVRGLIKEGNALELKDLTVDAVVTDLPYGRSSYLTGRDLDSFYRGFIESAERLLKEGGYLVCVLPKDMGFKPGKLRIIDKSLIYIHKSLTRRIYVLRKT